MTVVNALRNDLAAYVKGVADHGVVADVSDSHDKQLPRRTREEMPIAEVAILRYYHPILRIRYLDNLGVSGRVAVREVAGVDRLVASTV